MSSENLAQQWHRKPNKEARAQSQGQQYVTALDKQAEAGRLVKRRGPPDKEG